MFETDGADQGRHDAGRAVRLRTAVSRTGFVFSADGRYLYGSSYYTGVSNIFRYDLDDPNRGRRHATPTSDCSGRSRSHDDELIVFRYSGAGSCRPRRPRSRSRTSARSRSSASGWRKSVPSSRRGTSGRPRRSHSTHAAEDAARIASRASLRSRIVLSDRPGLQGHRRGRHALQFVGSGAAQSAPCDRQLVADRRLVRRSGCTSTPSTSRYDWRGRAEWNKADFYDLFGPTKTGRKGYDVGVGHHNTLHLRRAAATRPRRRRAMLAGNLDRLPEYQNVPVDIGRLLYARCAAAVRGRAELARERGRRDRDGDGRRGERELRRTASPVSTVLRNVRSRVGAAGRPLVDLAPRARRDSRRAAATSPLANFYFGGFGNNYVDHGDEKRYRE